MKIKLWLVWVWSTSSLFLHADEKIFHMIYAENQPAYFNENEAEQKNRDLVYCIKTDNNFYVADVTNKEKNEQKEVPIKLYALKKQKEITINEIIINKSLTNDDIMSVEGQLMLIGQPIIYKKDTWIMPAVVKKKYFSFFQSTDLCVILQKNVKHIVTESTGSENRYNMEETKTTEYMVYTIAEGHRTLANFVDIVETSENNDQKGLYLRSSSRWPTLKVVNLHNPTVEPNKKDNYYFLDSGQNGDIFFDIEAQVSKSFFNKKQIKSVTCRMQKRFNEVTKEVQIPLENMENIDFLPKLSLNPDVVYNSDKTLTVLKTVLNTVFSTVNVLSENVKYKAYVLGSGRRMYVPTNKKNSRIVTSSKEFTFPDIEYKNKIITASTYDYKNNRLFLAMYDKKGKTFLQSSLISQKAELNVLKS